MSKTDREHMNQYLQDMIKDKPKDEPIEKTLATFCERYSVSMAECKEFYDKLVKVGKIKEK
jgi:hypothetical protein